MLSKYCKEVRKAFSKISADHFTSRKGEKVLFFITFLLFFPKFYILHYFEEKEKKEFFMKRKESPLQRIKKCPVVSFEKDAECYIQENLTTTRSLNRRKKIILCSETKHQKSYGFVIKKETYFAQTFTKKAFE